MLKMTHLSKVYRTEVVETYALRDFNIDVKEGEFVAVMGPSGSGKTTFLTIAGLLESFTGGEYLLDGVEVRELDDNARPAYLGFNLFGHTLARAILVGTFGR